MTIELSREQEALIEKQLATGRYGSRAEVIAEALELLDDDTHLEQIKLNRLRAEIQKGLDSGDPKPLEMDTIKAEARRRHNKRQTTGGRA